MDWSRIAWNGMDRAGPGIERFGSGVTVTVTEGVTGYILIS